MKRELVLKREHLAELGTDELVSVVGAGSVPFTFQLLCGPATLNTLLC